MNLLALLLLLAAPRAAFTVACVKNACTFSNLSSGANRFRWDFGDLTSSTVKSPAHAFSALGSYTVKLTALSGNGQNSTVAKAVVITVRPFLLPRTVNLPGGGEKKFCAAAKWGDGSLQLYPADSALQECKDRLAAYEMNLP